MLVTQTRPTLTATQPHQTEILPECLPYVELNFRVIGKTVPVDHGYKLYSALSHWQSKIHELESVSIQNITGSHGKQGQIYLNDRSTMRIRLPADLIGLFCPLAGKSLTIEQHKIRLGIPEISLLKPASNLRSHIVSIKDYEEPQSFLEAAERQLKQLGIQCTAKITVKANGNFRCKTIKIQNRTVVGFGLEVINLSDEDSLKLQTYGIGGRHKMGCGIFVPM